jgi:ketosteroid isomerase-like protein
VLALHHSTAVGQSSGVEVQETDSATVWTVRDGQVVHAKLFLDRRDAYSEAGIPYPQTE